MYLIMMMIMQPSTLSDNGDDATILLHFKKTCVFLGWGPLLFDRE